MRFVAEPLRPRKSKELKAQRLALGLSRKAHTLLLRKEELARDPRPAVTFYWVQSGMNWHKVNTQPAGSRECARRRKQKGVE